MKYTSKPKEQCVEKHLLLKNKYKIEGNLFFIRRSFLEKSEKRNGVGRPKWTKINVQISKVPEEFCKGPLGKTRCDHSALFPIFP
jgi:hypothetical protein